MKRILLYTFLILSNMLWAQLSIPWGNQDNYNPKKLHNHLTHLDPYSEYSVLVTQYPKVSRSGTLIGQAPNAFGTAGTVSNLSASEQMNTIAFIHRSNYLRNNDFTSGALRYDISFDGGKNWNLNQGPIWNPTSAQGNRPGPARFPMAALFHYDSTFTGHHGYFSFFAPTVNGDNDSWGGMLHGTTKLDQSETYATVDTSGNGVGWYVIPTDYTVANNKAYGINLSQKSNSIEYVYRDTIVVHNGLWKPFLHEFDFTKVFIPFEVGKNSLGETMLFDAKIALDSNGNQGFVSVLGYSEDYHSYGIMHPTIFRTTDGGFTWKGPYHINLDSLIETSSNHLLLDIYEQADTSFITQNLCTGSEHDLMVDKWGNPHLLVNIFPAGHTIINPDSSSGDEFTVVSYLNGLIDIYSLDKGLTWKSKFISSPFTWRGTFGVSPHMVVEENRPQMAKSKDGSKIFYYWFDTHSNWGAIDNVLPDAFVRGYDWDTDQFIANTHRITFTGDATFGCVAPEMWADQYTNGYTGHVVTQQILPNSGGSLNYPTQFHYHQTEYYEHIDLEENEASLLSAFLLYPNPATTQVQLELISEVSDMSTIKIIDMTGRVLHHKELLLEATTTQYMRIPVNTLEAGVYYCSVEINGRTESKKLVIQ